MNSLQGIRPGDEVTILVYAGLGGRFTLGRYGNSSFEVIDNAARPTAKSFLCLPAMPLADAEKFVNELNEVKK